MYEDSATQASSSSLTWLVKGAVFRNYHHVNSNALVTSLLRSQSKVKAVTSVVLDNEKDPGGSWVGRLLLVHWI